MGFLNLSAWQPVGGRQVAERRATVSNAQPPRYYYDNLRDFQGIVDRFFAAHGRRPKDVAELYLWQLEQEGALDDDRRAADLADLFSYYDIEPNSLLAMVSIFPDRSIAARQLLDVRHLRRTQGHRPPEPTPIAKGLA
jgi:hypothetical protein